MAADSQNSATNARTPAARYELRDANGKRIFAVVGGLLLSVLAAELALQWLKAGLERTPPPTDRWSGTGHETSPLWTQANAPRLQIAPPEDLAKFREREDALLTNYAWINRTAGIVRIPIERAMDLLVQRGLPVRAGMGQSRLGPSPYELQQQRTNATEPETPATIRPAP